MPTLEELQYYQSLPLNLKVSLTKARIRDAEFYGNDFGHIPDPPDRGDCETCIHKREKLNGMEFEEWCVKQDCEYEGKMNDKSTG